MMLPLAILSFVPFANVIAAGISAEDGISYEDLKQLNVSCHPKDTCAGREELDPSPNIIFPNTCSCHVECSSFGTCCIDSPHRGESPGNPKCIAVDFPKKYFRPSGYYMVQSCPENAAWKHLCEGALDRDGDILKIAPVTSLDSNTTYKNYYCFRCYELTDDFLYWSLKLLGGSGLSMTDDFKITYNDVDNTWSATAVDKNISIPVTLQFLIPQKTMFPVIDCNPGVITDCPDSWEDDAIRRKCNSYSALLYKTFGPIYRNVHCAICNSQPIDELSCVLPQYAFVQKSFSFSHLIDINRFDGEEKNKREKCAESEMWDPYGKKCRKLSCALPGYVIKDGKCVPP